MISETAAQLFNRLCDKPNLSDLDGKIFFKQKDDIFFAEFAGNESCGKTELMLNSIVNTIMPKEWNNLCIKGMNYTAIVIDLAYKFPAIRLITLLENRIKLFSESNNCELDIDCFVKDCLSRFYKFVCNSTSDFINVLSYIPQFVNENPGVCLVAIDNIEVFYWIDKVKGSRSNFAIEKLLRVLVVELKINVIICRTILFEEKNEYKKSFDIPKYNLNLILKSNNLFVCSSKNYSQITTFTIDRNGVKYL
ncbi:DNA repair protein XRCC2 isoform X1 [Hydra vulgaris]|uniref:DNA repair protein XRCC2 n=1 Tax=Hydra vulgaris TaxID=6087 RepID=T2MIN0_HYDVU|nr:DNA repair protein XRCC2 [Hydra vulgaris]